MNNHDEMYLRVCNYLNKAFEILKAPGSCSPPDSTPDYEEALSLIEDIKNDLEEIIGLKND